jgi:hypothetical protein
MEFFSSECRNLSVSSTLKIFFDRLFGFHIYLCGERAAAGHERASLPEARYGERYLTCRTNWWKLSNPNMTTQKT